MRWQEHKIPHFLDVGTMIDGTVIQWAVVAGVSLAAAVCDFRTRRIPNALTVPAFAAGLLYALWAAGASGFADAVKVSVLLALPFILLFLFSHGGAGDAKLMGAVGAWLGLQEGTRSSSDYNNKKIKIFKKYLIFLWGVNMGNICTINHIFIGLNLIIDGSKTTPGRFNLLY